MEAVIEKAAEYVLAYASPPVLSVVTASFTK